MLSLRNHEINFDRKSDLWSPWLKRACRTENPYRCIDQKYSKITQPTAYNQTIQLDHDRIYDGKCIDVDQTCDSEFKIDCPYGEDESSNCSESSGRKCSRYKKEDNIFLILIFL